MVVGLGRLLWFLPFAAVAWEVASFYWAQSTVVDAGDWSKAATVVRKEYTDGDLIVSSPAWTDPLLRHALGDLVSVQDAGRSDLSRYSRLWALSIRGSDPPEAPSIQPTVDRDIGPVRVRRWDLGQTPVVFNFLDHVQDATVTLRSNGEDRPCPWRRTGFSSPGGVHQGVMPPAARHVCPSHDWLWVGATVIEDLTLKPRACVWQHPQGSEPIRSEFVDVPLGERIVLHGGLFYDHEVPQTRGPVEATVYVNGKRIGRMTHHDGDGWKRSEFSTRSAAQAHSAPEARGAVSIEVTAKNPDMRTFCWSASIQKGAPRSVDP